LHFSADGCAVLPVGGEIATKENAEELLNQIEALLLAERKNVEDTIPLVQRNSEFGYEPAMDYQCDEESLRWKLKQMDFMLGAELSAYQRRPITAHEKK